MPLVTHDDLRNAMPFLENPIGEVISPVLFRLMQLDKVNRAYQELCDLPSDEFFDACIDRVGITVRVDAAELAHIPSRGPFITISNHAFGGVDGIILLKIMTSARPDYKALMNYLLARIGPIAPYGLSVNPFDNAPQAQSSYSGIREAISHLKEGRPLGVFPSGEVSSYSLRTGRIEDKSWPFFIVKLIRKARVPVIPVYFSGTNSLLFHLLGLIHPALRTARLPAELFNKSGKEIRVRIGRPISLREQDKLRDQAEFRRYLRMRTYSLGIPAVIKDRLHPGQPEVAVIPPVPTERIEKELTGLNADHVLFTLSNHTVYCCPSDRIPGIMTELGRLREITYREVGEGTLKALDTDDFDRYYDQLFIWDATQKKIVGGYRIGYGDRIMEVHGIRGFYTGTLFRISEEVAPVLRQSLELGRSFITRSYQKKPLPLFLLWKGILQILLNNPGYRYMIGPVSISNAYSELSRSLTVEFLKRNHLNRDLASSFRPRIKFKAVKSHVIKKKVFRRLTGNRIGQLEHFIQAFEPLFQAPVLLKKYLGINSEVLGFNVDPHFNNCLDVLLITDVFDIPEETIRSLSKRVNDGSLTERVVETEPSADRRGVWPHPAELG